MSNEEDVTISNITPTSFDKYVMSTTLPSTYLINGEEPILITGPTQNWKICNNDANASTIVELLPPYVKRIPNANSMIIDMVDSNNKAVLVELEDGSRINSLKMTPNPDSLSFSSSKIINRYNTMTRWVEEHWGDDIDTLNFSGSTYSFNATLGNGAKTGLTSVSRNYSEAYNFLKFLVDIYRTNGYLYQEANGYTMPVSSATSAQEVFEYSMANRFLLQNPSFKDAHPRHGMLRERVYNRISFDYMTVLGYFESFDITDDSTTPFRLLYSTVFKAEKTIWTVGL